jgi:UPF0176 protein
MAQNKGIKNNCRPREEQRRAVKNDGIERVTLSFYRYVRIAEPEVFRVTLNTKLHELGCLGRIYVASEGINAQMNVPKQNWDAFDLFIQSLPELNGIPYKIAVEETNIVSFYKLTIKVRKKIVADGLDDSSFDVTKTGEYLTAREMNEYIENSNAVIVDMRNAYESEIGHFKSAITPDVDNFRDELKVTPELLRVHLSECGDAQAGKNKKIALYCTGGIRCEKASAWLRHNGFEDVKHLKGGIIDYKRQVEEEGLENKFRGKNFVFDERMGERIGDEVISFCHLCHINKSDVHRNCKNASCHVLFLCCDECIAKKSGYCSYTCIAFDSLPRGIKKLLTRNNYKKKFEHFKKHRLRRV